jgi:hypothetical protein
MRNTIVINFLRENFTKHYLATMKSCKERLLYLLSLSVADRKPTVKRVFRATDLPDSRQSICMFAGYVPEN